MGHRRATVRRIVVTGLVIAAGCSTPEGGDGDLTARFAEQTGLERERAHCVVRYSERSFSDEDVDALAEDGLAGLPRNQWEVYQRILSSCAYADDDQLRSAIEDRADS